jgi:hypothetical protein
LHNEIQAIISVTACELAGPVTVFDSLIDPMN